MVSINIYIINLFLIKKKYNFNLKKEFPTGRS